MKKYVITSLILLVLLSVLPMAPVAAANVQKPDSSSVKVTALNATLTIASIGDGTVRAIGKRWLVTNRPVAGAVASNVFNGTYQLSYSGLLNQDQSGNVYGTMSINTPQGNAAGVMSADVGVTAPIGFIVRSDGPHTVLDAPLTSAKFALLTGTGAYKKVRGEGTFEGQAYLILDSANVHVIGIANGSEMVTSFTGSLLGRLASQILMKGSLTGV